MRNQQSKPKNMSIWKKLFGGGKASQDSKAVTPPQTSTKVQPSETVVPSMIMVSVGRIRHGTDSEAINHDGEAFTQAMREVMSDYYPRVDITDGKNMKLMVSDDTFTVSLDVDCVPSDVMKIQRAVLAALKRQGFKV